MPSIKPHNSVKKWRIPTHLQPVNWGWWLLFPLFPLTVIVINYYPLQADPAPPFIKIIFSSFLFLFAVIYTAGWLYGKLYVDSGHRRNLYIKIAALVCTSICFILNIFFTSKEMWAYLLYYLIYLFPALSPIHLWYLYIIGLSLGGAFLSLCTPIFNSPISYFFMLLMQVAFSSALALSHLESNRESYQKTLSSQIRKEKELQRISADLHDILGQNLTAINLHTQVTQKILQNNRCTEAAQQLETIFTLSRQTLADLRLLITRQRELDLEAEIQNARQLFELKGLTFYCSNFTNLTAHYHHLAAWVLREGSANILHHAKGSNVILCFWKNAVFLINDGTTRETSSQASGRTGNGLTGLHNRLANFGIVSWGTLPGVSLPDWHQVVNQSSWPEPAKLPSEPKNGFCLQVHFK